VYQVQTRLTTDDCLLVIGFGDKKSRCYVLRDGRDSRTNDYFFDGRRY
jgi:hypothetical protein